MELPTPDSTPQSHPTEGATRSKQTTAARVNKSSGPATNTAEARKNKKGKKTNEPKNLLDQEPGEALPFATDMDISPSRTATHPPTGEDPNAPSERQRHIPPPTLTLEARNPDGEEAPATAPLPVQDPDVLMDPPANRPGTPTTPTQATRQASTTQTLGGNADIMLGPNNRHTAPPRPSNQSSISNRLEEVEVENLEAGGHPIRNPIDKYSRATMPPIQDSSPTAIFENIDIGLVKEWELRPGGKLIAVPFDNSVSMLDAHDTIRSKILTAITEILDAQEASVAAPRPPKEGGRRSRTPISFLIYNITKDQIDLLLERGVWSSKTFTFRVAPFATTCPSFFFALKGFGTTALGDIYPIVQSVWGSEDTKDFIDTLLSDIQPAERGQANEDVERIIASMYLVRLDTREAGSTLAPRFNVYADCTNFPYSKLWSKLRTYLLGREYISALESQSKTEQIPFRCTCCHGVDHPRGLCPFPSLNGWNGPRRENDEGQRRLGNGGPSNSGYRANRRFTPY